MVKQTQEWLNKTYKSKKGFTKFNDNEIDGITGQGTFKRLVQALQIELNENFGSKLTVDGDFGKSTLNALPLYIEKGFPYKNIVKIIQGSFWCKGYSAGPLDGIFGKSVDSAVKKFERDAGIPETGSITGIKLQGIMNTDAYFFQGEEGSLAYHQHRVQKAMNRKYCTDFGLIAPNGLWERKSHKMLIKCCQKVWGITNIDGAWGNDCKKAAPTLTNGTTNSENVLLLSWALTINGFYTGEFTSTLSNDLLESVRNFQDFMCIKRENVVEKGSWASLLSSKGDTGRDVKAFDTATRLTEAQANFFKSNGYTDVGRYLTNTVNGTLDKKMTLEELKAISNAGLKVFPIYQTRGNNVGYFTNSSQGHSDAKEALKAAHDLFFPYGTTIYFAVDYDVKTADIEKYIVPYFRNIKAVLDGAYKIGVYGPRAVCNILASHGLTSSSFVADMSSGFTCNIGQPMPKNWAYEQVVEVTQGGIGIDRCNISSRGTAIEWIFPSSDKINPDDYNPVNQTLIDKYMYSLDSIESLNASYSFEKHTFIDDKRLIVYNTLKRYGLGIYALAGFLGNIETEGFSPKMSGHDGSVGICQWRNLYPNLEGVKEGQRKTNFISYAEENGAFTIEEKENVQLQANFILEECNPNSKYADTYAITAINILKNIGELTCVSDAADCVTAYYERCVSYPSTADVNANSNYAAERFDLDKDNTYNHLFYLDTPKRRGYAEIYYSFLLDMESH